EDAAARVGLHRVAQREAVRRAEGEGAARGRFQEAAVVDVAGRAEPLAYLRGLGRGEEGCGHRCDPPVARPRQRRYQSRICSPVQMTTSDRLATCSKMRRTWRARWGAPIR